MKLTKESLIKLIKESWEEMLSAQAQIDAESDSGDEEILERIFDLAQDMSTQLTAMQNKPGQAAIMAKVNGILDIIQEMMLEQEENERENR
tara:strand:- start:1659 stop:1931 length:273 start_codon:yes stop_codon:yes gene_type:complete